jgi:segregation and condensation protein B
MERHERAGVLEALLFASDEPLTVAGIRRLVEDLDGAEVRRILEALQAEYEANDRGVTLLEVAGGWIFVTREAYAPWVERLMKGRRKVRLSRAALETVAVVAYKQPITRQEIERIRGVDAGGVLATLLERDLVMIKGRDPGPGKPLLYGTTQEFLNYFGLNRLSDLPRLDEISALAAKNPAWSDAERARFERAGVEPIELEGDQPELLALGVGATEDEGRSGEDLPEGLEPVRVREVESDPDSGADPVP